MGYINDFRAKLTALIEDGRTEDAVKFAADKVLESYHNGADSVATADAADVPRATAPRGERKASKQERPVASSNIRLVIALLGSTEVVGNLWITRL
jgi:hypothetical protein